MEIAEALAKDVGARPACDGLAISRASYYRWKDKCVKPEKKYRPPLSLSLKEKDEVLDILHGRQFIDMAPQEVYHALLDGGRYLCSPRTMYRLLEANSEVRERRDQLSHISYTKPELLAEGPNKVLGYNKT
jgi:putative transposase